MVPGSPQTTGPVAASTGSPVERDRLAVGLHRQLLQVGGEALEVLVVGQDRQRLGAEEVRVPDGEQAEQHGQVGVQRGGAEVLVHGVEAGEHLARSAPGRWRSSWTGRWPSPSSSARRPSPRSRTCSRCRCRSAATSCGVGRHGHEVAGHGGLVVQRGEQPGSRAMRALVIVSSVVNVFEAMMNSVSLGSRSRVASAKSVPSTLETKRNVSERDRCSGAAPRRPSPARGRSRRCRR